MLKETEVTFAENAWYQIYQECGLYCSVCGQSSAFAPEQGSGYQRTKGLNRIEAGYEDPKHNHSSSDTSRKAVSKMCKRDPN